MIIAGSLIVLAWIATYVVHSLFWLVPGIWFARRRSVAPRTRALVLLVCVVAPFLTTTITQVTQVGRALTIPGLRIEEDQRIRKSVDAAGHVQTSETGGLTLASRVVLLGVAGLAAMFLVVAAIRAAGAMRARREAVRKFGTRAPVTSAEWSAAYDSVLGTRTGGPAPRLTTAEHLSSPVALSGEVCIPTLWLARDDRTEMRVVIAHELEHVVWRDPQVLAALQFLKRALPWQPLLALALVAYLEAAEEACDTAAIRSTGDARSVAQVLLRLAPVHSPVVAFSNLNSGRGVRQRIERIVAAPTIMRRSGLAGSVLVATLLVLSAALPYVAAPRHGESPDVEVRMEVISEQR